METMQCTAEAVQGDPLTKITFVVCSTGQPIVPQLGISQGIGQSTALQQGTAPHQIIRQSTVPPQQNTAPHQVIRKSAAPQQGTAPHQIIRQSTAPQQDIGHTPVPQQNICVSVQPTAPQQGVDAARQPTAPQQGVYTAGQPTAPQQCVYTAGQPTAPQLGISAGQPTAPQQGVYTAGQPTAPQHGVHAASGQSTVLQQGISTTAQPTAQFSEGKGILQCNTRSWECCCSKVECNTCINFSLLNNNYDRGFLVFT